METIDLHGLSLEAAKEILLYRMDNAYRHGEKLVRIIHGQGKHSEFFPVIKSMVRHWLEESQFGREKVEAVFRGEDGSPYTSPNAGETVVVLKGGNPLPGSHILPQITFDEEEAREARRNAKAIRADHLRSARRRGPRIK